MQDVLPHDDEHDYLNDAYLDDDNEDAQRDGPSRQSYLDENNRDSDIMHLDKDLRKMNQPFRNTSDVDLRHSQDVDFRNIDYDRRQMPDDDYRRPPLYNRDQDFRYNDDEEMEEDYGDDYVGGYHESRNWHQNQFNQNRYGNPPRNQNFNGYQNFRNQGRNESLPFRQSDDHWAGGNENFRGRGGWRGPPRGNPRGGRGNPRQGRGGGPNQRGQGSRGGGPASRGQPPRGRMF